MLSINAAPFRKGAPLAAELPQDPFSGTSLTLHSEALNRPAPSEADTPGRRAALEKDPTLGTKRAFKTALKPQPRRNGPMLRPQWSLYDLLPELARTYRVDFVADSYWSSAPALGLGSLPQEPTALYALLDDAAGSHHRWDRVPTKWVGGSLIRLRSRTWFLDRPREIPLRYVRRWREEMARRGSVSLEAYLELVTTLTDTQMESLSRLVAAGELPEDLYGGDLCREMLRLYASLLPAQQETLRHGGIIRVSQLTPGQQGQFVAALKRHGRMGLSPAAMTPDQLDVAGLALKQVPLIRTIDRTRGVVVSDEPAAPAGPQPPKPVPGSDTVDRIPVTQLLFLLARGEERLGGVGLIATPFP